MAEMTMNEIVHAAVRRDLARVEAALRAFPDGDSQRARQLQRAWDSLWEQLHHHHESEDAYVWPYVRSLGVLPAELVDEMEAEHSAMAAAMTEATAGVHGLVADPRREVAERVADQVAEAARVTVAHLVHEEREVMPTVVERVDTPEWKAVEKQLRKAPPGLAGRLFAWVQDGADDRTLASLRANVPPPVLFVFSKVLGRSYHREVAPVWR
jgi:hemerythrin-like domain-containing protein